MLRLVESRIKIVVRVSIYRVILRHHYVISRKETRSFIHFNNTSTINCVQRINVTLTRTLIIPPPCYRACVPTALSSRATIPQRRRREYRPCSLILKGAVCYSALSRFLCRSLFSVRAIPIALVTQRREYRTQKKEAEEGFIVNWRERASYDFK